MDNVCNRCLFSIPSKVEMAEEQEYLRYLDSPCVYYAVRIALKLRRFYKPAPQALRTSQYLSA